MHGEKHQVSIVEESEIMVKEGREELKITSISERLFTKKI